MPVGDKGKLEEAETTVPTKILLQVGESVFETSKEELQNQDQDSYFHLQFSGRWMNVEGTTKKDVCNDNGDLPPIIPTVVVQGRSGRLFQHVLYYLRFGDIPRKCLTAEPLLDQETIRDIKLEAEFYLLPKLADFCDQLSPHDADYASIEPAFDEFQQVSGRASKYVSSATQRLIEKIDGFVAGTSIREDEEAALKLYLRALQTTAVGDLYSWPSIEKTVSKVVRVFTGTCNVQPRWEEAERLVFSLHYVTDMSDNADIDPFQEGWFFERYDVINEDQEQRNSRNISYYMDVVAKRRPAQAA